ncbi:hypothetical protein ACJJTC_017981 [Scirpophaga incertulas]
MDKFSLDFDFNAIDVKKEWTKWLQAFTIYLKATKKHGEPEDIKIAILLHQLGSRGIEIYNTFEKTKEKVETFNGVIEKFNNHFKPKINILYERYKFNKLALSDGQPLPEFITALKIQAQHCEFTDMNNMKSRMSGIWQAVHHMQEAESFQCWLLYEEPKGVG